MRPSVIARAAVILFGLSLLAACIGTSPPTSFYVLDPVVSGAVDKTSPAIGVGPIRVAKYLDRLPIVRRDSQGQLSIATFEMWAEPLDGAIARVVTQNLEAALGTSSVVAMPWPPGTTIDYQVLIAIDKFEPAASGQVTLICRWTLIDGKKLREELAGRRCEYQAPGGSTVGGQIQAMDKLLGMLSTDIAAAIVTHDSK